MSPGDVDLTCRQCGKRFVFTGAEQEFYEAKGFTLPGRCRQCRLTKQNHHHLTCSQCGTELEKGVSLYCTACLASLHLELELKTKQSQQAASAAHTRLEVTESQRAELAESLRQKEQLVAGLEQKISRLSQDLDKALQLQVALAPLQQTLNGVEGRLEALEHAQNKVNERMLQLAERMHEMYENTGLLEIIKRSLRQYHRQDV